MPFPEFTISTLKREVISGHEISNVGKVETATPEHMEAIWRVGFRIRAPKTHLDILRQKMGSYGGIKLGEGKLGEMDGRGRVEIPIEVHSPDSEFCDRIREWLLSEKAGGGKL